MQSTFLLYNVYKFILVVRVIKRHFALFVHWLNLEYALSYFALFGIEECFNINVAKLSPIYQTLQKTVHPDKFAHASAQEQLIAVQKSAEINDAYQTLKQPIKRAEYLLVLREFDMPSEQASFQDTQFLMQQMELREMLEDIQHASDIDAAVFNANETLDTEYEKLALSMEKSLNNNSNEGNLLASNDLRKLKFFEKLRIELDLLEDQLFDD